MAVFRCKMCGGDLSITEGASSCTCQFCGTEQTLPTVLDERLQILFNRANVLRMKAEFDKAEEIYERILLEDEREAEAYWGLILCKYGVEYVEDPKTSRRIPTCYRTSYDAITADEDCKNALKYADVVQRRIYETEAKAINDIQKGILAISQKEEPYDVFLCYKETDVNGKRTQDSVFANEIYYQLIQEGFKVFYAAITLEDKLGSEYEPYIFSALNTAKVMLAIGTKAEYFNAVWVKNEWSRFLKLMKKDRSKLLIPCYRDMDAYELPEEFAHLQAQNMSKIGFITDLIRGIKKVLIKETSKSESGETVIVNGGGPGEEPLLKRAFLFLEDGDWARADEFCEKVLNLNPHNAQAYIGKLMSDLMVHKQEELVNREDPFDDENNYQKAVRFAEPELKEKLEGYIKSINERNETNRLNEIYYNAVQDINSGNPEVIMSAIPKLNSISGWRDASELALHCPYWAEEARKNLIYNSAVLKASMNTVDAYSEAISLMLEIRGWKDVDIKIPEYKNRIDELIKKEEAERKEKAKKDKELRSASVKTVIFIIVAVICAMFVFAIINNIITSKKYSKGEELLAQGSYSKAMSTFGDIDSYKDAHLKYTEAFIALKAEYKAKGDEYLDSGDLINAAIMYTKAGENGLAKHTYDFSKKLAAGENTSIGITEHGIRFYETSGEREVDLHLINGLVNILEVNKDGIIGLDSSGKILIENTSSTTYPYWDRVKDLTNLKDAVISNKHFFGLSKDGTVKYASKSKSANALRISSAITSWTNIVEIGNIKNNIWGLDKNGTLHLAGNKNAEIASPEDFTNIEKLGLFDHNRYLIGLKSDNTLVFYDYTGNHNGIPFPTFDNTGITDFYSSNSWLIVVREDGTVVAYHSEHNDADKNRELINMVQKGLADWNGIVSVQYCAQGVAGISIDGKVHYQILDFNSSTDIMDNYMEIESIIESWTDIVFFSSLTKTYGDTRPQIWSHVLGLHEDGTVSSLGTGIYFSGDPNPYERSNGSYDKVNTWKLWRRQKE